MTRIDIVSLVKLINSSDGALTTEDERLVIGREDKKIALVNNDVITTLNEQAQLTLGGADTSAYRSGKIEIPTQLGNFIVHWGHATVTADSSGTYDFPIAFPKQCFTILGSNQENDQLTSLMIKVISKSQFTVSIVGGNNSEIVAWVAFGY